MTEDLSTTRIVQVPGEWNRTEKVFSAPGCLDLIFEAQARKTPGSPAATFGRDSLTYSELDQRADLLAAYLQERGVGPDVPVGVCLERSLDLPVAVLGILKAGGAYLPLDPEYPLDRLSFMLEDTRAPVLLTQESLAGTLRGAATESILLDRRWEEIAGSGLARKPRDPDPENLAYVIYTSGSTGKPKGVAMGHRPLANLMAWQLENSSAGPGDRTLQFTPLSFDVSCQELFSTWISGGNLILITDQMRLDAINCLKFIEEQSISRIYLPFVALQHLAEVAAATKVFPKSLKEVITAGEQLLISPALADFFSRLPDCTLVNQYGPAETHVVSSYTLTGPIRDWPSLPPIGKPIANTRLYVVDQELNPVPVGVSGELLIGGKALSRGYLNRPQVTAEKFIENKSVAEGLLYRTGDLAEFLPDGNIRFLGRMDDQVKIRGYRIELGEIEAALGRHPEINQAVVTARQEESGEKRLAAYVIPASQPGPTTTRLRGYLAESLPDYMIPAVFVKMDEFPRTPSGKVDRRSLPDPGRERPDLGGEYVKPGSEMEEILAGIWRRVLDLEEVGIHDGFFELGGNSLLSVRVIAALKEEQGLDLPILKVYQYPTISALADYLSREKESPLSLGGVRERARHQRAGCADPDRSPGVAIVGLACRYPDAGSVDEFWENLCQGRESITFFSESELDSGIPESLRNDPDYVRARGVLKDIDKFDAGFFKSTPREAELTDPQQRVMLELAWSALENAGLDPASYPGLIGVFAGVGNNTYYLNNILTRPDILESAGPFTAMVGNEKDYVASRVSHKLNLKGPSLSIHTACSTSLVSVCQAFQSLVGYQCDVALAGGVSIHTPQESGYLAQEGTMLSTDGHCRPFDAKATGTLFNNGAGVVVLKRLDQALEDGDRIYAVIKGVGVNNDGAQKVSFAGPSVEGQAAAIAMAQAYAGVDPEDIGYVETHGTGTPLGDPIEVEALTQAFRLGTDKKGFCPIGSLKGNIGHSITSSGVAGLIKAGLSLYNQVIPPSINYEEPNPEIDFGSSPFFVNTELRPWPRGEKPRLAGVSSFGFGGTNAHLILEEPPLPAQSDQPRPVQMLPLSAKTGPALEEMTANLSRHLEEHPDTDLADAAFTLQTGRSAFEHRRIAVCRGSGEAIGALQKLDPTRVISRSKQVRDPRVIFMFPGQGSQYVDMGLNLYESEPLFKETLDRCAEILTPLLGRDLREVLYPDQHKGDPAADILRQTFFTQPALFSLEYSLALLLNSWGIRQEAMIGHSIGEFVAACLAGVFSLEDALSLVAARGRLMQELPKGSMLSVRLPEEEVARRLGQDCAVAAVNGPTLCVASGPDDLIQKLKKELEEENIPAKILHTSHAFHSPMMDPAVAPMLKKVKKVKLSPPRIPFVSTVTADWIHDHQALDPVYWAGHMRATVRFAQGVRVLWEDPERILLEVGPRTTAATLARQQAQDKAAQVAISCLADKAQDQAEWISLLKALGSLWLNGVEIDWKAFYSGEKRRRIPLPAYPFQRKRHWIEPGTRSALAAPLAEPIQTVTSPQTQDLAAPLVAAEPVPSAPRKERLVPMILEVVEETSGEDLNGMDQNVTFLEMGLDSLVLTQLSLALSRKFGLKISFRQLMEELPTLGALAGYMDEALEPEPEPLPQAPGVQAAPVGPTPAGLDPAQIQALAQDLGKGSAGALAQILDQQLQIISRQLRILERTGQAPSSAVATLPKTAPITPPAGGSQAGSPKAFGAGARIKTSGQAMTQVQQEAIEEFIRRYEARTRGSKEFTQKNRAALADPRAVSGFNPAYKEAVYPIVIQRSAGSRMWDIDGNEYIDFIMGFGANLFGHSPSFIVEAIHEQLDQGIEIGPQHPLVSQVAKLMCEMTGQDRAAFCNTGSEAVLGAMRLARTVTGRDTIAIFHNSYHGIFDEVVSRGTRKLTTIPAAPGIPRDSVKNLLILDYGTQESLEILRQRADDLAAIMVEPVQSRALDLQPAEFLQALPAITESSGAALIFDEVITGFRAHPGGAQAHFKVRADLATYGKIMGGGMPIGAITGKPRFMDGLDGGDWNFGDSSFPQVGVTYFAGTFVRHPLTMAAAKAALTYLKEQGPGLQENLNRRTADCVAELAGFMKDYGAPLGLKSFSSAFRIAYLEDLPFADLLYPWLRSKGIHMFQDRTFFLTTAHTDKDIETLISAIRESVIEMTEAGLLAPGKGEPAPLTADREERIEPNSNGHGIIRSDEPPLPGARLGRDPEGRPGWFVPDPERAGKYLMIDDERLGRS